MIYRTALAFAVARGCWWALTRSRIVAVQRYRYGGWQTFDMSRDDVAGLLRLYSAVHTGGGR